jgi:hypothetical protein
MATIATSITVSGGRITWDGDAPKFRDTSQLSVYGSGLTVDTISVLFLYRGIPVAQFLTGWSAGLSYLVCETTLNTTQLAVPFSGRADGAVARLSVAVYNSSTGSLVASGTIPCRNNPADGYDDPTDLTSNTYMTKAEYDADDDGVIDDGALPETLGGSGALVSTESFTLTSGQISQKYVTLDHTPDGRQLDVTFIGLTQRNGIDYTYSVATARIGWSGLTLESDLIVGDELTVEYTYSGMAEDNPLTPQTFALLDDTPAALGAAGTAVVVAAGGESLEFRAARTDAENEAMLALANGADITFASGFGPVLTDTATGIKYRQVLTNKRPTLVEITP